jgi:hypothetical protein
VKSVCVKQRGRHKVRGLYDLQKRLEKPVFWLRYFHGNKWCIFENLTDQQAKTSKPRLIRLARYTGTAQSSWGSKASNLHRSISGYRYVMRKSARDCRIRGVSFVRKWVSTFARPNKRILSDLWLKCCTQIGKRLPNLWRRQFSEMFQFAQIKNVKIWSVAYTFRAETDKYLSDFRPENTKKKRKTSGRCWG